MRSAGNFAFAKLEDFSREPEDHGERFERELEARVAEALEHGYQRGFEAGRHQAESAAEAHLNEMRISFTDEMAARQSQWQTETGDVLAETLQTGLSGLSDSIEGQLAALLKPLIKDALYRNALHDFHHALDHVVTHGVSVEIRGSEDLVRGVEQRLADNARYVSTVTPDDASIEVKCDETTISANFAAWIAKIEEHLA